MVQIRDAGSHCFTNIRWFHISTHEWRILFLNGIDIYIYTYTYIGICIYRYMYI